ncbi:MAG: SemiSWEET family transporter [Thermoproteota archaeon]|nr:SemiSWEET family transporter [Thermoproteota archaeon]
MPKPLGTLTAMKDYSICLCLQGEVSMDFGYDSLIGISAAFLTTLSFLPQIVKAYRTRRMKDVSRYLIFLFSAGSLLWISYGIIHHDLVIVGANVTAAVFNLVLLYYSFVYGSN